jgi:ADP-ribose pyrophosphatase YjhB (NUDIX family)
MLQHTIDVYNGVLVSSKTLPDDELLFGRELETSLKQWSYEGRKGVWLRVPAEKASFISVAIAFGFEMHQCNAKVLILTKWLPTSANKLPRAPFTSIGVSGFVLNSNHEVLAVKEKTGPGALINWKTPGGMMDPGEYVHEAAVREVFEETGIRTEFVSVLSMRHMPDARMGNGDIYITCLLKALSVNITIQEDEIADAKWIKMDDFLAQTHYKGVYKKILQVAAEAAVGNYNGWTAEKLPVGFRIGDNFLYHGLPHGPLGSAKL